GQIAAGRRRAGAARHLYLGARPDQPDRLAHAPGRRDAPRPGLRPVDRNHAAHPAIGLDALRGAAIDPVLPGVRPGARAGRAGLDGGDLLYSGMDVAGPRQPVDVLRYDAARPILAVDF